MCLILADDQTPPTGDKVFFKAVNKERRSVFYKFHYPVGEVVVAEGKYEVTQTRHGDRVVQGGAIHVYTIRGAAILSCVDMGDHTIKVLCRKEHWLAWGKSEEACYSEVEALD